ncbi:MAG: AMP-binding protein, partial [Nitrososphaerales archaeon]
MADTGDVLPTQETFDTAVQAINTVRARSLASPDDFWKNISEELFWSEKTDSIFEELETPPYGKWFSDWKTNITYNALDRQVKTWRKNKVAYYWEGEDGSSRVLSYGQLYKEVCKFSNALKKMGVGKGDRVTIYLPMIPELPIAMLATLRLGAIHSVIFAGFTAQAIADRVNDSSSKVIITADGAFRRGKLIHLKFIVDEALKQTTSVENVIVVKRAANEIVMDKDRDSWY